MQSSPFASSLLNDVLVVIVTEAATQFLIIHLWLILPYPPPPSYLNEIFEFRKWDFGFSISWIQFLIFCTFLAGHSWDSFSWMTAIKWRSSIRPPSPPPHTHTLIQVELNSVFHLIWVCQLELPLFPSPWDAMLWRILWLVFCCSNYCC